MKAVFADTFYWIALTTPADPAYRWANQITADIVTTDEVLSEYLTFFAGVQEYLRQKACNIVQNILQDPGVSVIPQSRGVIPCGPGPLSYPP